MKLKERTEYEMEISRSEVLRAISMNNAKSALSEAIDSYYEQENARRTQWIEDTMRDFVPEMLYLQRKSEVAGVEACLKAWLKEEGYRMEISPDNLLIQVWKGNEQVAQYQTILPSFVKFIDGEKFNPEKVREN